MARVKIKFYGLLRSKTGVDEFECEASDVKEALKKLKKEHGPEIYRLQKSCHIYLNKDNLAFLKGVKTKLKDGDVLHVLSPAGGG
ncbi:MAG TPA: MoaD/ThiS family protein [bacterium]|nr:MoaD/ThiS family protein [bacterium]